MQALRKNALARYAERQLRFDGVLAGRDNASALEPACCSNCYLRLCLPFDEND